MHPDFYAVLLQEYNSYLKEVFYLNSLTDRELDQTNDVFKNIFCLPSLSIEN